MSTRSEGSAVVQVYASGKLGLQLVARAKPLWRDDPWHCIQAFVLAAGIA